MNPPRMVEKPKKKKDAKARPKVRKGDGLCVTCNNEPVCTHDKSGGPVMQCEEFDGYETPAPRIEHIPTPKKGNGNGHEGRYKGLCTNCDHRATCANAGLEGGVWHCEEYE